MSLPGGVVTAATLCLLVVLSGCADSGDTAPATDPETREPCTPTGGERVEAVPLSAENSTNVTATPFDSLSDAQQAVFPRIRNTTSKEEHPVPDFPKHVRHDDTVYEVVFVSVWDDCV